LKNIIQSILHAHLIPSCPAADLCVSTPEQKCVGWPEQKYIGDAGRKAPNWGPFLRASGLGRIIHRGVSTGAA
jgi:hypothetical protein